MRYPPYCTKALFPTLFASQRGLNDDFIVGSPTPSARRLAEASGERWWKPEIHRLMGETLFAQGPAGSGQEAGAIVR